MLNKVTLIGRLTKDCECATFGEHKVYKFQIAVDRRIKNKDGEKITDFISCEVWNKSGEVFDRYCKKGHRVCVCGELHIDKFVDKEGNNRYSTSVAVSDYEFLESKNSPKTEQNPQTQSQVSDDSLPF